MDSYVETVRYLSGREYKKSIPEAMGPQNRHSLMASLSPSNSRKIDMKYLRLMAPLVLALATALAPSSSPAQGQRDFVYLRSDSVIYGFSVSSNGGIQSVPGSPFGVPFDSTSSGFFGANRIIVN